MNISIVSKSAVRPVAAAVRLRVATLLTVFALALAAGSLTACNTVAGAGKDTSAAGHAITKEADKVKNGN